MTVPPPKGADSGRKTLTYRGGSGWASVRGGGSGAGRGPHFTLVFVRLIFRLRGFLTMATPLNDPTGQRGSSGQRGRSSGQRDRGSGQRDRGSGQRDRGSGASGLRGSGASGLRGSGASGLRGSGASGLRGSGSGAGQAGRSGSGAGQAGAPAGRRLRDSLVRGAATGTTRLGRLSGGLMLGGD